MKKTKIMIVEDDRIVAEGIKHSLQELGYAVVAIISFGEKAIETIQEKHPELVLMDIVLKGEMDGIDTTERIHAKFDIPVIYLTAYADDKMLERAKLTGPFGYIIKPFEDRELRTVIEMALYKHSIDKKLKKSEEKYRSLIENLHEGIWRIDKDAFTTYVNSHMAIMLGYTVDEMIGKHLFYFMDENGVEICKGNLALREQGIKEQHEFELLRKDGSRLITVLEVSPIINDDGSYVGALAAVMDITERKLAEEAREEARKLLQRAIDGVEDPIMVIGLDYEIKLMNRVVRERYMEEGKWTKPLKCHMVSHNRDIPCEGGDSPCPLAQVAKTMTPVRMVHEHYQKNGEKRSVEIIASPLFDEQGTLTGIIESSRDITERRKLEGEIQKARKLESLGVLAGGIAHDFNNLLTSFLANISMAKMHAEPGGIVFMRLTEAEKASVRARDLTQQLLTFSKGGAPIKKTASIPELIKDSTEFTLRGSNVKCEYRMLSPLWSVDVDTGQISQVIQNLINNADQAMPNGGTIQIKVENIVVDKKKELALADGKYINISIKDQGCGISEEYLDKIFDPYFTTKQKGSGLGLATCYSIINNHNGLITTESKLGVGTTFHILLPASDKKEVPKKHVPEKPLTGRGRILVMDDEEIVRQAVEAVLNYLGYEVALVEDGLEAIERYTKARDAGQPFDAVIMDLTIPGGMGGKEAIEKLLEIDPAVKAIVSSGYANDPIMADYKRYGFCGVAPKPYRLQEMSNLLHEVVFGESKTQELT